jgi:cytochrome c553
MERMADDARALDSLLVHSPPASNNELRAEVSALLADMRRAAAEIDPAGLPTNHPKLERHMSELIVQIEAAMRDASAEPPSYYLAWSMAAACVHCHGEERSSPPVAERR